MVLPVKLNLLTLNNMMVSRVVLVSGLLTFLYLVEFCIGLRSVYYTFSLWNAAVLIPPNTQAVSWTLCVACLFVCVGSSFTVNVISAIWEQKQMKENQKEKNAVRFACHIFIGGMIWRYVNLWFADSKERQKKEALLLTMVKFLFTQFFTIPVVIVHASLLENIEEVIYDVCSILCISVNLLLTCIMFTWCKAEVNELKKWNYETIDLLPLIFCQSSDDHQKSNTTDQNSSDSISKEMENNNSPTVEQKEDIVETTLIRIIVLFQTFSFSFGRLLALGILLKVAGIYAVSIMFLQLLISVVYLKFQVPFLVSDSLPKWRQLTRLAFMSYILIFEWHLNRDPKTGYDFTSNIKHSILYYCVATLESFFYFITWEITYSYATVNYFDDMNTLERKFARNIIIMGSLSLLFSLMVHFLLLFWKSRRLPSFLYSLRRHYLSSKLKMANSGKNCMNRKTGSPVNKTKLEISNPIPIGSAADACTIQKENNPPLEKRNSYKDLREPLDDEIEIYVRKSAIINKGSTIGDKKNEDNRETPEVEKKYYSTSRNKNSKVKESRRDKQSKKSTECGETDFKTSNSIEETNEKTAVMHAKMGVKASDSPSKASSNSDVDSNGHKNGTNTTKDGTESMPNSSSETKASLFSKSMNQRWSRFSSMSKKLTGNMLDHIQRRKEQFQNFRNPSIERDNTLKQQKNEEHCSKHNVPKADMISAAKGNSKGELSETLPVDNESLGEYSPEDSSGYDQDLYDSSEEADVRGEGVEISDTDEGEVSNRSTSMVDLSEEVSEMDPSHLDGDDPCPCFLCATEGEGRILRRRSSSVPPETREHRQNLVPSVNSLSNVSSMVRSPSSPSIRIDMKPAMTFGKEMETSSIPFPPMVYLKGRKQNLSLVPVDNRVEHFV